MPTPTRDTLRRLMDEVTHSLPIPTPSPSTPDDHTPPLINPTNLAAKFEEQEAESPYKPSSPPVAARFAEQSESHQVWLEMRQGGEDTHTFKSALKISKEAGATVAKGLSALEKSAFLANLVDSADIISRQGEGSLWPEERDYVQTVAEIQAGIVRVKSQYLEERINVHMPVSVGYVFSRHSSFFEDVLPRGLTTVPTWKGLQDTFAEMANFLTEHLRPLVKIVSSKEGGQQQQQPDWDFLLFVRGALFCMEAAEYCSQARRALGDLLCDMHADAMAVEQEIPLDSEKGDNSEDMEVWGEPTSEPDDI